MQLLIVMDIHIIFVSHAVLSLYLSHMQYCHYICLACSTVIIFVSHAALLFKTACTFFFRA